MVYIVLKVYGYKVCYIIMIVINIDFFYLVFYWFCYVFMKC